jgi:hypothetical protein
MVAIMTKQEEQEKEEFMVPLPEAGKLYKIPGLSTIFANIGDTIIVTQGTMLDESATNTDGFYHLKNAVKLKDQWSELTMGQELQNSDVALVVETRETSSRIYLKLMIAKTMGWTWIPKKWFNNILYEYTDENEEIEKEQ